jgi:hypothetical protein
VGEQIELIAITSAVCHKNIWEVRIRQGHSDLCLAHLCGTLSKEACFCLDLAYLGRRNSLCSICPLQVPQAPDTHGARIFAWAADVSSPRRHLNIVDSHLVCLAPPLIDAHPWPHLSPFERAHQPAQSSVEAAGIGVYTSEAVALKLVVLNPWCQAPFQAAQDAVRHAEKKGIKGTCAEYLNQPLEQGPRAHAQHEW